MGNHFFSSKAQNFMQFPPYDFHQNFPDGHAHIYEGITYDILAFYYQLHFITSLSLTLPPKKITRKLHRILNAR